MGDEEVCGPVGPRTPENDGLIFSPEVPQAVILLQMCTIVPGRLDLASGAGWRPLIGVPPPVKNCARHSPPIVPEAVGTPQNGLGIEVPRLAQQFHYFCWIYG